MLPADADAGVRRGAPVGRVPNGQARATEARPSGAGEAGPHTPSPAAADGAAIEEAARGAQRRRGARRETKGHGWTAPSGCGTTYGTPECAGSRVIRASAQIAAHVLLSEGRERDAPISPKLGPYSPAGRPAAAGRDAASQRQAQEAHRHHEGRRH